MSSKKASMSVPKLVRSGNVRVRERSTFGGTAWKTKKVELDNEALTIINVCYSLLDMEKRGIHDLLDFIKQTNTDSLTRHC
jgi:hypothetical protein